MTYHNAANGLLLGDGWSTDGSVSFVSPTNGGLSFWYYKFSDSGYYYMVDDWYSGGSSVSAMRVLVNGSVVYTATADTGWVKMPFIIVHAGDTVKIEQTGNHDDGGASCNSLPNHQCHGTYSEYDPYNNVSVYVDDVYINTDTTPPVTTATPGGGTYTSPQTVTLTANEPATIFYTTNGTTPTTSSAVYSTPLSIPATTTLKYFAVDTTGNVEAVKTQTYTVNIPDTGSIITSTPGTYTHVFTGNATVYISYISAEGGGAGYWEDAYDGADGYNALIVYDGVTKTIAYGGAGGHGYNDKANGANGSGSSSVGGTVQVGAGGPGELSYPYEGGNGGNGGKVVGGSFAVTSGKVLSVTVPDNAMANGSVSLSWN
jgi:hypothetical protein